MGCSIGSSPLLTTSHRYQGAGNSFLIYEEALPGDPALLAACGVDGILLLRGRQLRIYNADGSEAEMCGNGIRCVVRYLEQRGMRETRYFFSTLAGEIEAWHEEDVIGVRMPPPRFDRRSPFKERLADFYTVGVPHVVLFFDAIDALDITQWADPRYNVNLVQVDEGGVAVRTFERGVNRETLSCGTGATAAAAAARRHFNLPDEILVQTRSGAPLMVRFLHERTELIGPADVVEN